MSEIEWQEDQVLRPAERKFEDVCADKGLPAAACPDSDVPRVIVSAKALESLNHYLQSDLSREHGGVLVGKPYLDPLHGRHFVDIQAAIPALEASGSPVYLQFTAQAWDYISGILEENFPELVIVGWYHSHPGLGVFMSATDQASHQAFYNQPWSLALVVDPVQDQSGWFIGPECIPLESGQVIVYGQQPGQDLQERPGEGPARETGQELGKVRLSNLSWFLPAALLCLAGLFGLWLIAKSR